MRQSDPTKVSGNVERKLLERGQRVLDDGIGAKVVDARAHQGAVVLELAHHGTDDGCFQVCVPLEGIHFWDEDEPT